MRSINLIFLLDIFMTVEGWPCVSPVRKVYNRINTYTVLQFSADLTNLNSPRRFNVKFHDGTTQARITYNADKSYTTAALPGVSITGDTAGNIVVTLENVQLSNAGIYMIDSTGFQFRCNCLYILGAPVKPTITLNKVPSVGQSATLTCSSTSTTTPSNHSLGLTYNWRVDSADIPSGSRYSYSTNRNTLTLSNIVKDDANEQFTCTATEDVTDGYASSRSDSFTFDVHCLLTTEVYDFGSWMNLNSLKNHSHPHVFKITADENGKSVIHYKKWTTDKKWLNCSGSELYLIRDDASTKGKLPIIQANTDRLDIERMSKDIDMVARFYKKPEIASWWNRFFEDIITEEETDTTERDVMNDLRANRWRETDTRETDPLEMDLPQIDEPIPPVIIGKKQPNTTRGPLQEGDLVLLDSLRFTEQWPQLGKVIHTEEEEVIVQWFWGSKTSTWTPATKPVKGERNRREPFLLTFKKEVIWLSGFNLTPSGMLPKAIRDKVDSYFD